MRHPPVRRVPWVTSKKCLEDMSWDVHDLGAHSEEDLGGLVLREEVREVVDGAHVRDDDLSFLDDFADVEVAARDVLRALVELRVVGEVVRRLVVAVPLFLTPESARSSTTSFHHHNSASYQAE